MARRPAACCLAALGALVVALAACGGPQPADTRPLLVPVGQGPVAATVTDLAMSADAGTAVAVTSAENIVLAQPTASADSGSQDSDLILVDIASGAVTEVPEPRAEGTYVQATSPDISADGRVVVYVAAVRDAADDRDPDPRVMRWDRDRDELADLGGAFVSLVQRPSLSADGGTAAFVAGRGVDARMHVWEAASGAATAIGDPEPPDGESGDHLNGSLSPDGRWLAFHAAIWNPGEPQRTGAYLLDRDTGAFTHLDTTLSVPYDDMTPIVSEGGRLAVTLAFSGDPTTADQGRGVWLHDLGAGTSRLVTALGDDTPAAGEHGEPRLSRDGSTLAFYSASPDLLAGDTNGATADVVVYRLAEETLTLASVDARGRQAGLWSSYPALSHDGRVLAWAGLGNLGGGPGAQRPNIYLRTLP